MDMRTFVDLALRDRAQLAARAARSRLAVYAEDAALRLLRPRPGLTSHMHLCILGMRRSGNHAIVDWLRDKGKALFGQSVFLNNLPPEQNGFRHRIWYPEELSRADRQLYQQCRWKRFPPEGLGLLIRSYEDFSVAQFDRGLRNDFYYGQSDRFVRTVLLRDPLNLFASRIRSGYTETHAGDQVSLYVDHVTAVENDPDLICLDFNAFIGSAEYRSHLLDQIGLAGAAETVRTEVSQYGGGSSFGDSTASATDLTRRFLHLKGDPDFEAIRRDPRIERIVQERYPDLYGTAYVDY